MTGVHGHKRVWVMGCADLKGGKRRTAKIRVSGQDQVIVSIAHLTPLPHQHTLTHFPDQQLSRRRHLASLYTKLSAGNRGPNDRQGVRDGRLISDHRSLPHTVTAVQSP